MPDTPEQGLPLEALVGQQELPAPFVSERRQSSRVAVRIPILLDSRGRRDPGWTVTANEAGALVTCAHPIEAGERVTVLNVTTGKTAVASVVAPLLSESADRPDAEPGFRLALRFETFGESFWGAVFRAALHAAEDG